MDRIPILRMGRFLLVSIQVDMHDRLAVTLQDDLTARITRRWSEQIGYPAPAFSVESPQWPRDKALPYAAAVVVSAVVIAIVIGAIQAVFFLSR